MYLSLIFIVIGMAHDYVSFDFTLLFCFSLALLFQWCLICCLLELSFSLPFAHAQYIYTTKAFCHLVGCIHAILYALNYILFAGNLFLLYDYPFQLTLIFSCFILFFPIYYKYAGILASLSIIQLFWQAILHIYLIIFTSEKYQSFNSSMIIYKFYNAMQLIFGIQGFGVLLDLKPTLWNIFGALLLNTMLTVNQTKFDSVAINISLGFPLVMAGYNASIYIASKYISHVFYPHISCNVAIPIAIALSFIGLYFDAMFLTCVTGFVDFITYIILKFKLQVDRPFKSPLHIVGAIIGIIISLFGLFVGYITNVYHYVFLTSVIVLYTVFYYITKKQLNRVYLRSQLHLLNKEYIIAP